MYIQTVKIFYTFKFIKLIYYKKWNSVNEQITQLHIVAVH